MSDQPVTESRRSVTEQLIELDDLCERIEQGVPMRDVAAALGVTVWSLRRWYEADPMRLARVTESRTKAARAWDELAEWEIRQADNPFDLSKAKELAHHYRWRASKIARMEYGERQQVELSVRPAQELTDDELARIASSAGVAAQARHSLESD